MMGLLNGLEPKKNMALLLQTSNRPLSPDYQEVSAASMHLFGLHTCSWQFCLSKAQISANPLGEWGGNKEKPQACICGLLTILIGSDET